MNTKDQIERARDWCFTHALPLWTGPGLDRAQGGVTEALTFDGAPAPLDYKRTRVCGRQLYVYSHATLLGFGPGAEAAEHAYTFLTRHAWLGPEHGWARRISTSGAILDPTPDLYDLAFALFGLGWYARAGGPPDCWMWIDRTLSVLERKFHHSSGFGYWHALPSHGPRLQNPHMHLLEAALAGLEAGPHPALERLARKLVELFCTRLYDAQTNTLAEYFADNWSRAPGPTGMITEPGHQFEWAWILTQAERLLGLNLATEIEGIFAFAERYGVDANTGVVFAQVREDGVPLDRGTRTWPTTERIKAHLALFELRGHDPRPGITQSLRRLFEANLSTDIPGLWYDAHDADGRGLAPYAPASTLYHVFLALSELLRLGPQIDALDNKTA